MIITNVLKDKQTVMGLGTCGSEAYSNKHVKAKQNKQRITVFWITTLCTLEQVCVHMSSTCVCRLDHAYTDPYPKTLINTETEQKPKRKI